MGLYNVKLCAVASSLLLSEVLGSPVNSITSSGLAERQDEGCDGDWAGREAAERLWKVDGLGVGQFLENFLIENGEENWVNILHQAQTSSNEPDNWCVDIEGVQCTVEQCSAYEDPRAYFALKAVEIHQGVARSLNSRMVSNTLSEFLDMDRTLGKYGLGDDADHADGSSTLDTILSSVLGLVTTFAGMPGTGEGGGGQVVDLGPLSAAVSFFNAAVRWGGTENLPDPRQGMIAALSDAFSSGTQGLKCLIAFAHRGNNGGNNCGDMTTGDLPGLSGGYSKDISRYFEAGRWLINDASGVINALEESWKKATRHSMVVSALKAKKYFVFIDTALSEDACINDGDRRKWVNVDGDWHCADLWVFTSENPKTAPFDADIHADGGNSAQIDAMEADGFDLQAVFQNAVDCSLANRYGDGQPSSTPSTDVIADGPYPECAYNLNVLKGKAFWEIDHWEMSVDVPYFCSACHPDFLDQ